MNFLKETDRLYPILFKIKNFSLFKAFPLHSFLMAGAPPPKGGGRPPGKRFLLAILEGTMIHWLTMSLAFLISADMERGLAVLTQP
jgi:hypothetical protein